MKRFPFFYIAGILLLAAVFSVGAQSVADIEKQKQDTEQEIRETKAELNANEKQVNAGLASLRKIEGEIEVSQKEIETVKGQIEVINGNISTLEGNIALEEQELATLRAEYLKAIKKMRVARKQNSGMAFIFSSGSFNEARRRLRYMKEFSEWKDRRSGEIRGKVDALEDQRQQLVQARKDANVALSREQAAQAKLAEQRSRQQEAVAELRANSDVLRQKLARRQAEARKLSNQISALIAEQKAKEAEEKRKAEEQKRLAAEKAAAEKAAAEKKEAEAKLAAEKKASEKKAPEKKAAEEKSSAQASKGEYADARKRNRTKPTTATEPQASEPAQAESPAAPAASGFEGMKGKLPRPVAGVFKVVSPFGIHPISPELPDIMDENLGIDVHVANGANASAVYDGEVIKIYDRTNTPGFRNIVVLKHGDYITVYANLETLAVKSGQSVKQGQALGSVGSDFDDPSSGLIHFELWKNQSHLDPEAWLRK